MYNYYICLFIILSTIFPFGSCAPTFNLTAVNQINEVQISLSWTADPGATSYSVLDAQGNVLYSTRELNCVLTLPNGQVNTFKVVSSLHNLSNSVSKVGTQYLPNQPYNGPTIITSDLFVPIYPSVVEIDSTTVLVIFEEFEPNNSSCVYEVVAIINGEYRILATVNYDLCTQVFIFSSPSATRTVTPTHSITPTRSPPPVPSPTATPFPQIPKRYQVIIKGIPSGVPVSYKVRGGFRETPSVIFFTSPVSNPNAYNYRTEYPASRFTTDINAPSNEISQDPITLSPTIGTQLFVTFDIPQTNPLDSTIQYGRIVVSQSNSFSEQQYFYYYNGGSILRTYVNDAGFSDVNYDYTDYQVQVQNDTNTFYMPLKTKISGHLIEDTLQAWQNPGTPNNGFIIKLAPTSASSLNSLNLTSITLQTYNGEPASDQKLTFLDFDFRSGCPEKYYDDVAGLYACTFPSTILQGKTIKSMVFQITGTFRGPLAATLGGGVIFQDFANTIGREQIEYYSADYNSNIGFWPSVEGNFTVYANMSTYLNDIVVHVALQERTELPTPTPTRSMTVTPTGTPTRTASPSFSSSATNTPTVTPSLSETRTTTPSITPSRTISISNTRSPSISVTSQPSSTNSRTPTASISISITSSLSMSNTASRSLSKSATISPTPSVSNTRTSSPTSSPSLTPSTSPTPSTSISSTSSVSLTPSVSTTSAPSISITPTSSPSRPVSPPPLPSQSTEPLGPTSSPSNTPSPSFGVVLPTPSNSIQLPSATPSPLGFLNPCANGALIGCPVQPTEVVVTENQPTTFVLTSAQGNNVGVVNVPQGTVPDGYSIKLTPVSVDPTEVIQNNIVSATIDLTAYSPNNEVTQISSDVEICLDVSEEVDIDKSCLGFYDESKNPPMWVCQDECLKSHQNKTNTVCGKTSHFTSFAILLTGSSSKCGKSSFDHIFDDSWKDYTLIGCTAAGVILILIFIACVINFAPSKVLYGEEGTRARALRQKASSLLTSAIDIDAEEIV